MSLNATFISATFLGPDNRRGDRRSGGRPFGRRFAYQFNLLIFGGACLRRQRRAVDGLADRRSAAIMGIGLGAEFVVGYGMISEFVPPARRGRYTALLNLISSSGVFAVALTGLAVIPLARLARDVRDRRRRRAVGVVAAPQACRNRRAGWKHVGRTEEAETRPAGASSTRPRRAGRLPPAVAVPTVAPRRVPITVLFTRPVVRRTLLAIAVNITCLVGSYSFTAWIPSFFVKQGLSVTRSLGFNVAMSAGTVGRGRCWVYSWPTGSADGVASWRPALPAARSARSIRS